MGLECQSGAIGSRPDFGLSSCQSSRLDEHAAKRRRSADDDRVGCLELTSSSVGLGDRYSYAPHQIRLSTHALPSPVGGEH